MIRTYYTFGTDERYDYQGGWVEVIAPDMNTSHRAFKKFHPSHGNSFLLNCADWYSEEAFHTTQMATDDDNFGHGCWERITVQAHDVLTYYDVDSKIIEEVISYVRELVSDA